MPDSPERHLRIAEPPSREETTSLLSRDRTGTLTRASVLTAAGVMILATVTAYGFWLWALIQCLGLATEFQAESFVAVIRDGDLWELTRTTIAIIGAGFLTSLTWWIAVSIADDL